MMLVIIGKNKIKNSTRHFEKSEHSLLQVFYLPKCLTNFHAIFLIVFFFLDANDESEKQCGIQLLWCNQFASHFLSIEWNRFELHAISFHIFNQIET